MFKFIFKLAIKLNCLLGEHRFVYASFSYNDNTKLYYPHETICRDCSKLVEVGF